MKNYYKILQIDKDASPEIIKVAYKLLVKKNHPDLKEGKEKIDAEEKIKQINEAYDILSNSTKKAEYDQTLANEAISQEQYNNLINENMHLKKELNYFHNLYNRNNYYKQKYTNMYDSNYTYQNNPDSSSSEIKDNSKFFQFKNIFDNFSENIKTLIALIITFLIIFIIIKIPFLNNFLLNIFGSGSLLVIIIVVISYIYFFRNKK